MHFPGGSTTQNIDYLLTHVKKHISAPFFSTNVYTNKTV
jgi:hypothetical protein